VHVGKGQAGNTAQQAAESKQAAKGNCVSYCSIEPSGVAATALLCLVLLLVLVLAQLCPSAAWHRLQLNTVHMLRHREKIICQRVWLALLFLLWTESTAHLTLQPLRIARPSCALGSLQEPNSTNKEPSVTLHLTIAVEEGHC
jgi:hypothetical protein